MDVAALMKQVGKKGLFVGIEAQGWQPADFTTAAKNARTAGFDTLIVKRADGNARWYSSVAHLKAERAACLVAGVGFIPYSYSYGPAFGGGQYQVEADIVQEMMQGCESEQGKGDGIVCVDMEAQWNGHAAEAEEFCKLLQGKNGSIIITTWADPQQQAFLDVLKKMLPVTDALVPQDYTNWLATQEAQLTGDGVPSDRIIPAINVSSWSQNDPVAIVKMMLARSHLNFWLWEYQQLSAQATMIRQVIALMDATGKSETIPEPDHTQTAQPHAYPVLSGDSLYSIAKHLGLNWYTDLYLPNKATIESTAKQHGFADSQNGSRLYPGTLLTYKA